MTTMTYFEARRAEDPTYAAMVDEAKALLGAPYVAGDPVMVRDRPARVLEVKRVPKAVFGLQWALRCAVRVDHAQWNVEAFVYCDDNGRNVTKGQQVRPSDDLED